MAGHISADAVISVLAPCDTSCGYIAWTPSSDSQPPLNGNSLNVPALGLGPLYDEESGESPSPLTLAPTGQATARWLAQATKPHYGATTPQTFTSTRRTEPLSILSFLSGAAGVGFLNLTTPDGAIIAGFNKTMVEVFAYQAVMNTFNSFLLGDIYDSRFRGYRQLHRGHDGAARHEKGDSIEGPSQDVHTPRPTLPRADTPEHRDALEDIHA
ncbi:hypothetical protein B0T26DRAFT_673934 [Lasiosphaeria miniovina]|uniref:Uncharacterized protein n=1 Tax=Lasiosphaeria miniovina TaxID=1954250 RepID=A0AA40E2Y5_9PEZI|nr:uncharacterized protein B0T26DRAFT_673934 [Lasiosphaeria miniovina]KAK0722211.1 hypothetical protein B0T26DRAFT_673934 [Lasiosphaeria miniovina]